jgi:ABC-type multidrug transport system fused ATPase/permease subunit
MNLWQLFQKLRPFVRPYRILVIATLILTLIGSFTAQVNALTLQYAVDSINRLVEQGQGLTEGLHILITISVILLSKEIISWCSLVKSFMGKNCAFWYRKTWRKALSKNSSATVWLFLMPIKTKQVSYKRELTVALVHSPVWYKSFLSIFCHFLAVPL